MVITPKGMSFIGKIGFVLPFSNTYLHIKSHTNSIINASLRVAFVHPLFYKPALSWTLAFASFACGSTSRRHILSTFDFQSMKNLTFSTCYFYFSPPIQMFYLFSIVTLFFTFFTIFSLFTVLKKVLKKELK